MERAVVAAPGLIALMSHTQSDADEHKERLELLDSLQGFLDEEMDDDLALDVLDAPALREQKPRNPTWHKGISNMRPSKPINTLRFTLRAQSHSVMLTYIHILHCSPPFSARRS